MPIINDDIALTVLAFCNISTVAKCRAVSRRLKDIVDKELTLEKADFSTPTFRQRRNITDSTMTPEFIHIFRRASIICLDGTEVGHYGAMKLVTDFTKELHVERCPRVDLGKLINAIAGDRWLSYDIDPVLLYTNIPYKQPLEYYNNIFRSLFDNSWAAVMMNKDCPCRYIKIEDKRKETVTTAVHCHTSDRDMKQFTLDVSCKKCAYQTCKECQAKVCAVSNCNSVYCEGCATEVKCSLCYKNWCGKYQNVHVFQCYDCTANVCSECQPSKLRCSTEEYRCYCAQYASVIMDVKIHDDGDFIVESN